MTLLNLIVPFLLAAFGMIYYLRKRPLTAVFYMLCGILLGLGIFSGFRVYLYYPLIISPLSVIGAAAVNDILENRKFHMPTGKTYVTVLTVVCLISMFFLSSNTYMMKYKKADLPQYQFKNIICREENPTLLNYGFLDGGFYTACGIYPEYRFFCKTNLDLPEMLREQEEYVLHKDPMFIVTRNDNPHLDGYECITESSCFFESGMQFYYLYRRID